MKELEELKDYIQKLHDTIENLEHAKAELEESFKHIVAENDELHDKVEELTQVLGWHLDDIEE